MKGIINSKLISLANKVCFYNAKASLTTTMCRKELAKTYDQIPGPKNFKFFGGIFSLKKFGGDLEMLPYDIFLVKLNEKYGDLVKFQLFNCKNVN